MKTHAGMATLATVAATACAGAATPAPAPTQPAMATAAPPKCEGSAPTYAADVRPVLERRCFVCHAGNGAAAEEHDFSREETLRAQRSALADDVAARSMPPPSRPQLTDAEANTLLRWARCAASDL